MNKTINFISTVYFYPVLCSSFIGFIHKFIYPVKGVLNFSTEGENLNESRVPEKLSAAYTDEFYLFLRRGDSFSI